MKLILEAQWQYAEKRELMKIQAPGVFLVTEGSRDLGADFTYSDNCVRCRVRRTDDGLSLVLFTTQQLVDIFNFAYLNDHRLCHYILSRTSLQSLIILLKYTMRSFISNTFHTPNTK